jgi:hypothetical protein
MPVTGTLPAGFALDPTNHWVRGSGVINGYDFTVGGGYGLYLDGDKATVTITNCRLASNKVINLPWLVRASGDNGLITIQYCQIDGGGVNGGQGKLIMSGNGGLIVKYCYFSNVLEDTINVANAVSTCTVTNNLIYGVMFAAGAHSDVLQTYNSPAFGKTGDVTNLVMNFNTFYNPAADADGFPGMPNSFVRLGDEDGFAVIRPEFAYNSIVGAGSNHYASDTKRGNHRAFGTLFNITANDGVPGSNVIAPNIHDNYIDMRSVTPGFPVNSPRRRSGPGGAPFAAYSWSNNINLVNGAVISVN